MGGSFQTNYLLRIHCRSQRPPFQSDREGIGRPRKAILEPYSILAADPEGESHSPRRQSIRRLTQQKPPGFTVAFEMHLSAVFLQPLESRALTSAYSLYTKGFSKQPD